LCDNLNFRPVVVLSVGPRKEGAFHGELVGFDYDTVKV
jgi:hypothetical protein